VTHTRWIADRKRELFDLYAGERLVRKVVPRGGGWTWGYQLLIGDEIATGASIGEDEIRFFLDLPQLIEARSAFCVGVAFGLSTFALALAKPDLTVFGIDNFTEGAGTEAARRLVERLIAERVGNVRLYVGTSPQDTAACLAGRGAGETVDLVFIDGLHQDDAAQADFGGVCPYLGERSVVLWHNTYATARAFELCHDPRQFDTALVLRTYGALGIYFNRRFHPLLYTYLADHCLIWDDWQTHLAILNRAPAVEGPPYLSPAEKRLLNFLRALRGVPKRLG
jgi:predicted O-methyltransferase YrrM